MEHLFVGLQLFFMGLGTLAVLLTWVMYFQTRSRNQFWFAVFFTALSILIGMNTILSYLQLNLAQSSVEVQMFFMLFEQIPRVTFVMATVMVANSWMDRTLARRLNLGWLSLILVAELGLFMPGAVTSSPDGKSLVIGWWVYADNIVHLVVALYSIGMALFKVKFPNPSPSTRLLRVWIILSAIFAPGLVIDLVIYPQVLSQGIFTVPFWAFYRLYYLILAVVVVIYGLKHFSSPARIEMDLQGALPRFVERYHFTPREADVLALLLEGATNQYIGDQLRLSPNTVKVHVYKIFQKTGSSTRVELMHMLQGQLQK